MSRYPTPVLVAAVLILCVPRAGSSADLQRPALLPDAFEQDLYNRACALIRPDLLPDNSPYIPNRAICGTPLAMSIAANWSRLSKPAREAFAHLLQRPSRSRTLISSSRHFKIHYSRAGSDAVDLTDTDANGVPDYVDEVARTFETIWDRQIGGLGYSNPVDDGDGFFDIYIGDMASRNVYGMTWALDYGDQTTASYMEIDNDYAESIYQTRGLSGLHVTASHEFHHAIQFAYFAVDLIWWHEATATWMEEVVYPEVNDYLQYVDAVLDFPTASLDRWISGSDEHPYGASIFAQYLAALYGPNAVRDTWDTLRDANTGRYRIEDIDGGLPAGGFSDVLPGYAVWNYLTGSRSRSGTYPEGDLYGAAATETVTILQNGTVSGSGSIDHLAAEYIQVPTATLSGGLRASFTLGDGGEWLLAAILEGDSEVEAVSSSDGIMEIPNVSSYRHVVFMPVVRALKGYNYAYSYEISSQNVSGAGSGLDPLVIGGGSTTASRADFDGNGQVGFNDFISFAKVYGSTEGDGVYESTFDVNSDGAVDFGDFLAFAKVYGETVG